MRLHPDHPALQPQPDFKAALREQARQLLEAQDDNRVRRQKLLNAQAQPVQQPPIKNTPIGK